METLKLEQLAWYFKNNCVHSAPILSIMTVSNLHEDWACTDVQKQLFTPFGIDGVFYGTCHGIMNAECCFESKEALLESL